MSSVLATTLAQIQPLDARLAGQAQHPVDCLTKPPGSLGRLEELARRYVAITGETPPQMGGKAVVVFAADHGVTGEGVSAYPQEVTAQRVLNCLHGEYRKSSPGARRVIQLGVRLR
jgi:nicotinate-nucleotide--dimethylbenzimidazole phosphoribosyltransferase